MWYAGYAKVKKWIKEFLLIRLRIDLNVQRQTANREGKGPRRLHVQDWLAPGILSCFLDQCCELHLLKGWVLYPALCSIKPASRGSARCTEKSNFVLIFSSWRSFHQSWSGTSVKTAEVGFTFPIHCHWRGSCCTSKGQGCQLLAFDVIPQCVLPKFMLLSQSIS